MASVTIHSDFGAQENKNLSLLPLFPFSLPYMMRPDAIFLVFLSFRQLFHPLFFTLIKRLFSFSSLSAIRVVSSAYLIVDISGSNDDSRLWFRSPEFCMMYFAYKLNKEGDSKQPYHTPFPILNQSIFPCLVLTVASWLTYRFLRRHVRWFGTPISLGIFQFVMIHTKASA